VWIPTDENSADLFTKNLPGPLFENMQMFLLALAVMT
jgi:hypothetical protein